MENQRVQLEFSWNRRIHFAPIAPGLLYLKYQKLNIFFLSFRTQTVESARADAERVRLIGASEARAIEAVGRAEAEKMRMKASAYKQYGDAAIMALVLEALPQIAAEVAAPLAKTDEIVLLGGADKTTSEVNKLLGQLPPAVQALTGVDVTGALGKIPGATMKAA